MNKLTGRELDILIAERVFGHKVELTLDGPAYRQGKRLLLVPRYSEDFGTTFAVASWIAKRTGEFFCKREADGQYVCLYGYDENDEGLTVIGESAPHATCLAALEVLEMARKATRTTVLNSV